MTPPIRSFITALALTTAATLALPRKALSMPQEAAPWFHGSVEAAQALAKTSHKPLLIYWGAVWCPPCNELKSEVFNQPRFAELVAPLIAVHIDGDSDKAQYYSDKLHASGYPTVLLLSSDGTELMRLGTAVSLDEFAAALQAGLAAGQTFKVAREHALAGRASSDEWRLLAYYSSEDEEQELVPALTAQGKLIEQIPERLKTERHLLKVQLLTLLAQTGSKPADRARTAAFVPAGRSYFSELLSDPAALKTARAVLINSGVDILGTLYPAAAPEQESADKAWLGAMQKLAADPSLSVDMHMGAAAAPLMLFQLRQKNAPVPAELRQQVAKVVSETIANAKTPYQRKASISGAASLLLQSGDSDGARELLTKEQATSDTPWMYQFSLAKLEEAQHHDQAALDWAEKSRLSVQGRASRLQWLTEDLMLNLRIKNDKQEQRVSSLLKDYYQEAFALADGFQGRNAKRAARIAAELKAWPGKGLVLPLIEQFAVKCKAGAGGLHAGCQAHFAALGDPVVKS